MLITGYDVGGAHLKVAQLSAHGIGIVRQIPCPLWEGLDRLSQALDAAATTLVAGSDVHAVTMTGELTEIFPSRAAGVVSLVSFLSERLGPSVRFFMGLKGFGEAATACANTEAVGSANFLATVRAIAVRRKGALLIDMGSTTTDIVVGDRPQGVTDAERLQTGELVYTGYTRTSVPTIASRAPLLGAWQRLARDNFATMADVRRLLGELPDDVDQHETTDGRGKTIVESLQRMARGFGRDGEERHLPAWRIAAAHIRDEQLKSIYEGAIQVLSRPGAQVTSVVAAGIGAPVAHEIARRLALPCTDFGDLIGAKGDLALQATRCAPAVAVALLSS